MLVSLIKNLPTFSFTLNSAVSFRLQILVPIHLQHSLTPALADLPFLPRLRLVTAAISISLDSDGLNRGHGEWSNFLSFGFNFVTFLHKIQPSFKYFLRIGFIWNFRQVKAQLFIGFWLVCSKLLHNQRIWQLIHI